MPVRFGGFCRRGHARHTGCSHQTVRLDHPGGEHYPGHTGTDQSMNAQMDKAIFGDSIQDLGPTISGDKLTGYVNAFGMDEDQYVQRAPLSHSFAAQLVQDAKANIRPTNTVKYGVVVDRVDLRSFPTLQRAFDSASDTQFDNWQETAVDPATPVRVYHTNPQGNFIFVRTPHYRGWVPRNK